MKKLLILIPILYSSFSLAQVTSLKWTSTAIRSRLPLPVGLQSAAPALFYAEANIALRPYVLNEYSNALFSFERVDQQGLHVMSQLPADEMAGLGFDLGRHVSGLSFSLRDIGWVALDPGRPSRAKFSIVGYQQNGETVYPTLFNEFSGHYLKAGEEITVGIGDTYLNVFFDREVTGFQIYLLPDPCRPLTGFVLSDLTVVESSLPNPPYSPANCAIPRVLFAIDASSSLDSLELAQIASTARGLAQRYIDLPKSSVEVSVVQFGTLAQQKLLNKQEKNGTALSAAFNAALPSYSTDFGGGAEERMTNWAAAFAEVNALPIDQQPDLLIFYTDNAPNSLDGRQFLQASDQLAELIYQVDQIKQRGIHICFANKEDTSTNAFSRMQKHLLNGTSTNAMYVDGYTLLGGTDIRTVDIVSSPTFAGLGNILKLYGNRCTDSFLGLKAEGQDSVVLLSWEDAEPADPEGYEVYRSEDSHNWTPVTIGIERRGDRFYAVDKSHRSRQSFYLVRNTPRAQWSNVDQVSLGQQVQFSIYPNPSQGRFILNLESATGGDLLIYNNLGQAVYRSLVQVGENEVSVAGLSPGLYSVQVRDAQGQSLSKKHIIQ